MGVDFMKRELLYITIFLLICTLLMSISEKVNSSIITYYMPNLIEDIGDTLNNNKSAYIDGNMLSLYLNISSQKFMLDGKEINNPNKKEQYEYMKDNIYKVEKKERNSESYLIVSSNENLPKDITKIKTIFKINSTINHKTILINIIAVISGVILFFMYEINNKKRCLKE